MDAEARLEEVRNWAIATVAADDMTQWGHHSGYSHGVAVLRIVDNKPDGIWDSRKSDWWTK